MHLHNSKINESNRYYFQDAAACDNSWTLRVQVNLAIVNVRFTCMWIPTQLPIPQSTCNYCCVRGRVRLQSAQRSVAQSFSLTHTCNISAIYTAIQTALVRLLALAPFTVFTHMYLLYKNQEIPTICMTQVLYYAISALERIIPQSEFQLRKQSSVKD